MPNPNLHRPGRRSRLVAAAALAAMALAACTGSAQTTTPDDPAALPDRDGCRAPQPAPAAQGGSFEDANLIAAGEMFRVYGADADPLREVVTGEAVDIGGQPAWRLETTFAVTIDGERRSDGWTLFIGFGGDQLAVLCALGPDDVTWPPAADDL